MSVIVVRSSLTSPKRRVTHALLIAATCVVDAVKSQCMKWFKVRCLRTPACLANEIGMRQYTVQVLIVRMEQPLLVAL